MTEVSGCRGLVVQEDAVGEHREHGRVSDRSGGPQPTQAAHSDPEDMT